MAELIRILSGEEREARDLVVVDMLNDFVEGTLENPPAQQVGTAAVAH